MKTAYLLGLFLLASLGLTTTVQAQTNTQAQSGNQIHATAVFTAPAIAEKDTILCYVTDTQGHSNTATITLTVQ